MYRENAEVAQTAKPARKRRPQNEIVVAARWLTQLNEVGARGPAVEPDHFFVLFFAVLGVFASFIALSMSLVENSALPLASFLFLVLLAAFMWRFGGSGQKGHFEFGLGGVTLISRDARGRKTVVGPIPWAHVQSIEGDAWSLRVAVSEPTPRVLSARRRGPGGRAASSFRITAPEEAPEVALSDE